MLKPIFVVALFLFIQSAFAHPWCDLQATKEIQDFCYQHVVNNDKELEDSKLKELLSSRFYSDREGKELLLSEENWKENVYLKCDTNQCRETSIKARYDNLVAEHNRLINQSNMVMRLISFGLIALAFTIFFAFGSVRQRKASLPD